MKYPKLPKAFKAKWVKALRSGKYKQGKGQLFQKEDNQYCCLGVACVIQKIKPDDNTFIRKIKKHARIPKLIQGSGRLPTRLSLMNDYGGYDRGEAVGRTDFEGIATWIEKNL